jgi:hypothetical protein
LSTVSTSTGSAANSLPNALYICRAHASVLPVDVPKNIPTAAISSDTDRGSEVRNDVIGANDADVPKAEAASNAEILFMAMLFPPTQEIKSPLFAFQNM